MERVSTLGRRRQTSPVGRIFRSGPTATRSSAVNSSSGGVWNWIFTSVKRLGRRLPWRSRNGTPLQRQVLSITRKATKVSVVEPAATPSSWRYPGTGLPSIVPGP